MPCGDICALLKGHCLGKETCLGSHGRRQRVEEKHLVLEPRLCPRGHNTPLAVCLLGCRRIRSLCRENTFLSFSYPLVVACLYLILPLFYFVPEALLGK